VLPANGNGDFPIFTPAEAGALFSNPGGMQGWVFVSNACDAAAETGNCAVSTDINCFDIWLSVKSSVNGSGSVIIYSYEDHECVSAKVVLHTLHVNSTLSFYHLT